MADPIALDKLGIDETREIVHNLAANGTMTQGVRDKLFAALRVVEVTAIAAECGIQVGGAVTDAIQKFGRLDP